MQLDRVARVLRQRETAENLIRQLATVTRTITALGKVFGIELDDGPVEPSQDFAKYDAHKLALIAKHINASCESIIREKDAAVQDAVLARRVASEMQTKVDNVETKSNDATSMAEGKISALQQSVASLNRILANYTDQEDYVVGRIDPVTFKPLRFYKEGEDSIKATKRLSDADHLSLRDARSLRSKVVRSIRSRSSRVESMQVDGSIAILQVSLGLVKLTVDDDEE